MPAFGTRRTAVAVVLADFVPVPFVDTVLQNEARRWLVRKTNPDLCDADVRSLADAPIQPGRRLLLWPVKFVFRKLFVVARVVSSIRDIQEVRSLPAKAMSVEAS